ncbi:hypothetical protein RhiirA5_423148 [Rhizophagus irregularis]|uniref:Uncharacterized protein n=1 Tax=Rhizophagus irregularis TaxID=588596 RepID=A0A2N0PAJ4_9GLOM|nr:hypothetical protein RhiirA5_423148 [Rhizophagus irregularis]
MIILPGSDLISLVKYRRLRSIKKLWQVLRQGKKKKRSLIREHYYEEFSTEFWKESANIGTTSSNTSRRQPSRIPRAIPSPNRSRPTTPSISRPPSSGSRPVTPSFSQSAETINIYINYNEPDDQE